MIRNPYTDPGDPPQLDALVIAAYPGHAELACGGTLLLLAGQGVSTGILDLTVDDPGLREPSPRLAHAENAAQALGLRWRGNLQMPAGRIENTLPARLTLATELRRLRPRLLILPDPASPEPDLYRAAELAAESCRLAASASLDPYTQPHTPERVLHCAAAPLVILDVTAFWDRKIAALQSYPELSTPDAARGAAEPASRYFGSRIGVIHGEPFAWRHPIAMASLL